MNIELKSTGFLIDEMITTELKMEHFGKTDTLLERGNALLLAIVQRIESQCIDYETTKALYELIEQLSDNNKKCWDAQDDIMKYAKWLEEAYDPDHLASCAWAAVDAQKLNAKRNKLIRDIDTLLGEEQFTQLEKSYAKEIV